MPPLISRIPSLFINDIDDLEKDGLDVDLRILKCLANLLFTEELIDGFLRLPDLGHTESFFGHSRSVIKQTGSESIVGRDTMEHLLVLLLSYAFSQEHGADCHCCRLSVEKYIGLFRVNPSFLGPDCSIWRWFSPGSTYGYIKRTACLHRNVPKRPLFFRPSGPV